MFEPRKSMWNQEKLEIEPRKMELFFLQKTGAEVDKLGLNLLNQEQCRFLPRWDGEGFKPGVAYLRRHLPFHIYLSIHRFLVAWTVPSFLCKKTIYRYTQFFKTLTDLNCLWFKSHIVFSLLKHAKTTLFFSVFFQWWKVIQRHDWSLPGEAWIRPAAHIVRASPQRKSSSWWLICALTKARSAEFLAMACHGYHWDFLGNIKLIITIIII